MCVCVYVRARSLVIVFSTRQYRLLLNKYGLSKSLLENWTLEYAHTHTHRVIVYICLQYSLMTTYRPASVLIVIYARGVLLVGLLIRRRDHVAMDFMGHDLKQFKSLEVQGVSL